MFSSISVVTWSSAPTPDATTRCCGLTRPIVPEGRPRGAGPAFWDVPEAELSSYSSWR
jgi:hypothetical protein